MAIQVKRLDNGAIVDTPYAYSVNGVTGIVFVKNSKVFWKRNDSDQLIDIDGDSREDLLVNPIKSMINEFSLDLNTTVTPTDVPPVIPPSSLVPTLTVASDSTYKTLIGSTGSYQTRINLTITNDNSGIYAVQIASELGGGSLDGGGNPLTWGTLARQTNGTYYVTLPCSNTSPYLKAFWLRFTGNTGTALGNYVVFRTDGTDPLLIGGGETGGGETGGGTSSSEIISYSLESAENTLNLTQFPTISTPQKFNFVSGFGSPIYSNIGERDGKLIHKKIGLTHVFNIGLIDISKWGDVEGGILKARMAYRFNQFHHLVGEAVQSIKNRSGFDGGDGYWAGLDSYGQNFSGVSEAGAIKIGQEIGISHGNFYRPEDAAAGTNAVLAPGRYLFMDEENYNKGDANYGTFISGVLKGITLSNSDINVMFYGMPPNLWWLMGHTKSENLTDSDIQNFITTTTSIFNNSNFATTKCIVDLSFTYFKVPGLENEEIYKKVGSSYLLTGGKRQYRDDDFTINHFGQDMSILAQPNETIKYQLIHELTGDLSLSGSQYFNNPYTESATLKSEYYNQGYRVYSEARPFPYQWQPETELYVRGVYRFANSVLSNMLLLNKVEYGDYNLTNFRDRRIEFGLVRCPNTEPFTPYGNSILRRYTGKEMVLFEYLFGILSGVTTMESWADGFDLLTYPELKTQGNPVYVKAGETYLLNNSPYVLHIAAIQSVFKNIQGVNPSTFKYVHFYYPFKGEQNYEIIAAGIYTGSKFITVFLNPTLGKEEVLPFVMKVGTTEFNLALQGKRVLFKEFTVTSGLTAENFTLNYFNIYGTQIRVNGKISENISAHYV